MISTGIFSNIMYITELQNKPNVALHHVKGFSGFFFSTRFKPKFVMFSENFTMNLKQARKFICRLYHIFQRCSNLHFLHIKHCPNSFAINRRRKIKASIFLQNRSSGRRNSFATHFLLATCNVCPLAIPELFAQTRASDYWQIIHSMGCLWQATVRFCRGSFFIVDAKRQIWLTSNYNSIFQKIMRFWQGVAYVDSIVLEATCTCSENKQKVRHFRNCFDFVYWIELWKL